MNPVEPVPESRAPTGKVVVDCAPEVKEKFNFMSLFGLDPDPTLYSRMTETEGLPAKNLRHFLKATGLQEEQIVPLLGIVPRTMNGAWMPSDSTRTRRISYSRSRAPLMG